MDSLALVMPSCECGATNHIQNEKQAIPHERSGTNRQPQMEAWRPITLNVAMTIVWNMELQMDAAGEMSAATNESRSRVTQCLRTRRKSQEWFSSRLVRFSIWKNESRGWLDSASRQGGNRECAPACDQAERVLSCLFHSYESACFPFLPFLGVISFSFLPCEYHGVARAARQNPSTKKKGSRSQRKQFRVRGVE